MQCPRGDFGSNHAVLINYIHLDGFALWVCPLVHTGPHYRNGARGEVARHYSVISTTPPLIAYLSANVT